MIRAIKYLLILLILQFSFASCASSIDYSDYHESECEITKEYMYIEVINSLSANKTIRRSFQFDKRGVLVRVYSANYAPDYSRLLSIHHFKATENSENKQLSLKIKEGKNDYYETLGVVSTECVEKLSVYLNNMGKEIPVVDRK